jgi:hypothetical protein
VSGLDRGVLNTRWFWKKENASQLFDVGNNSTIHNPNSALETDGREDRLAETSGTKLQNPITADREFEDVLKSVQDAAVLVLVY